MSKRDRRVTARTKVTAPAADPPEPVPDRPAPPPAEEKEGTGDGPLAKVIPMPAFDPFAEADKRW